MHICLFNINPVHLSPRLLSVIILITAALYWYMNVAHLETKCFIFQSFTFLISSDYERAEWREIIREQQKKCEFSRSNDTTASASQQLSCDFCAITLLLWLRPRRLQKLLSDISGAADAHQLLCEASDRPHNSNDHE